MGAESVLSNLGQAYRRGRFELKNGEIQPHFAHSPKIIRVSPRGAPACARIRLGWPHSGLGGLSDGFARQLRASLQSLELKTFGVPVLNQCGLGVLGHPVAGTGFGPFSGVSSIG